MSDWMPEPGDFFRPRQPTGKVHIAAPPGPNDPPNAVRSVCGVGNFYFRVQPASGDEPHQCAKCWDSM